MHPDPILRDTQTSDIVIPIIGPAGAGKSTFINYLLAAAKQDQRVQVGEGLSTCTANIAAVVIDLNRLPEFNPINRRIVVLDTPGLDDDDHFVNLQIMGRVVKWLEASYHVGMSFGGLIFVQDISLDRCTRPFLAQFSIEKLNEIWGGPNPDVLKRRTVLVTTKWSRQQGYERRFERAEQTFICSHWKALVDAGARVKRLDAGNEAQSAWGTLSSILELTGSAAMERNTSFYPDQSPGKTFISRQTVKKFLTSSPVQSRRVFESRATDVVILVIGRPRAGKSSFINALLNGSRGTMKVSCTHEEELGCVTIEGYNPSSQRTRNRRIVILYTPGFDGHFISDFIVLLRIHKWLEKSYDGKRVLGGVAYFDDIQHESLGETTERNLLNLSRLHSEVTWDKVILVTSNWISGFEAILLQYEFGARDKFWKNLLRNGATVERVTAGDEERSAWRIVDTILQRVEKHLLRQSAQSSVNQPTQSE